MDGAFLIYQVSHIYKQIQIQVIEIDPPLGNFTSLLLSSSSTLIPQSIPDNSFLSQITEKMAVKVFITGVTGFVGGTVLTDLVEREKNDPSGVIHPSLSLTVLVRTATQASKINAVHPTVKTVIGDFNSHDLLVTNARNSDIVLHIAGDFESGIFSLIEGLASQPSDRKGIFIHVTGSASLIDLQNPDYGNDSAKVYSDVDDYTEIMAFPEDRWHVALEHKIIKTSIEKGIKTTILAPAQIYGVGRGTGSNLTYSSEYARAVLKRGRGFLLGKGESRWSGCSVGDVASAIVFVLDETVKEFQKDGAGKIEYGWDGYYFIEAGECSTKERSEIALQHLKGLGAIDSDETDELDVEEIKAVNAMGPVLYGTSSRSKADRLRSLGWKAKDDWRGKLRESTSAVWKAFKEDGVGGEVSFVHMNQTPLKDTL